MIAWVLLGGAIGTFFGYLFGYMAARETYYEYGYVDGQRNKDRKFPPDIETK